MSKLSRLRALAAALPFLVAGVAGCQTLVGSPAQPPGQLATDGMAQNFSIEVDPLHGAAFELPQRHVQSVTLAGSLMIDVQFPQVTYDASTGQTSVTMQITNAGSNLTFLKCQVGANVPVVTPAYPFNTSIAAAGASQTVTLVFKNPGGGSFNVNLGFTGILKGQTSFSTGSATGPVPTPTPTGAPTAAPTPTPTPAPTNPPTGAGTLVASADSSYGNLLPANAIDGDLTTMWANDGYQAASAWLAVDTGRVQALNGLAVKMRPFSGGASYAIEVSNDGVNYQSVTPGLRNTSWSLEPKPLPAGTQGRFVRLHFSNDAASPEGRFSVFEVQVNGAAGPVASPTPAPTPTPVVTPVPTPVPTPTPAPGGTGFALNEGFEGYALGSDPSTFVNVQQDGYSYPWLVNAPWQIVNDAGSKAFQHNGLSNTANLSFRRYAGNALGTANGLLPNRYLAEVDCKPVQSFTYQPTGDQGTQFFYLDPTHYVELQIKPNFFEVWICNNAQPFTSAGWTRVSYHPIQNAAGQSHHLAAVVDTFAHSISVNFDHGVYTDTFTDTSGTYAPLLTPVNHWFALRGTGNIVNYDNLSVQPR